MSPACSGPTAAATVAEAPHAKTNQNTSRWWVTRRSTRAGKSASAHTVSLRNAWLPRPSAKNVYRQLSCSIKPGSVSPSPRKASLVVPLSRAVASSTQQPGHTDHGGRPGAARGGTPPGPEARAAEPDHQRIGGQAAGGGQRERVRHVGEAEGAELHGAQRAGHVEHHGEVGQAGYRLIRDAPAQAPADLARDPLPEGGRGAGNDRYPAPGHLEEGVNPPNRGDGHQPAWRAISAPRIGKCLTSTLINRSQAFRYEPDRAAVTAHRSWDPQRPGPDTCRSCTSAPHGKNVEESARGQRQRQRTRSHCPCEGERGARTLRHLEGDLLPVGGVWPGCPWCGSRRWSGGSHCPAEASTEIVAASARATTAGATAPGSTVVACSAADAGPAMTSVSTDSRRPGGGHADSVPDYFPPAQHRLRPAAASRLAPDTRPASGDCALKSPTWARFGPGKKVDAYATIRFTCDGGNFLRH